MIQSPNNFTLASLAALVNGNCEHNLDLIVTSLCVDSRCVRSGSLFVAVQGTSADGHRYVKDAFARGAAAVVVKDRETLGSYPGIVVADTRIALSILAACFSGNPSEKMAVIGVTGSNGKTTVSYLVEHLLESAGQSTLRIGTVGAFAKGIISEPGNLTTPDSIVLQRWMDRAAAAGVASCVMEVSSHGLHQHRVDSIHFDVGVFTNLTRDHLDYHRSMEDYFTAKTKLFSLVKESKKGKRFAVINCDDAYGKRLADGLANKNIQVITYGADQTADLRIAQFEESRSGSRYVINWHGVGYAVQSPLIGLHNAYNSAAALAAVYCLTQDLPKLVPYLSSVPQVPGRLERISGSAIDTFVDYAHTPDAIEKVLLALRPLTQRKLWIVFGCGGDRDRGKRPLMMEAARRGADRVVITSDNPRTEDPESILTDIVRGGEPFLVEVDRRQAIERTLALADPGDIILIAGKGHEDYQIIGTNKIHFSDQEVIREIFEGEGMQ